MKRILHCSILVLLALAGCTGPTVERKASVPATVEPSPPEPAAATITAEDAFRRISYLASDELGGRDTPSPGLEAAARYIAGEFERLELHPAGENGTYLQRYPLQRRALSPEAVVLNLVRERETARLEYGVEYFAMPGVSDTVGAGLDFVGTSIPSAAERGELRDRVAVIYLPGLLTGPNYAAPVRRLRAAADAAGAVAVLFILDPRFPAQEVRRSAELAARAPPGLEFGEPRLGPAFFVRYDVAQRIFRQSGLDLDQLTQQASAGTLRPVPLPGVSAEVGAPARIIEEHRPPNVVAILPGSDPSLRDTYVVFSAHMDHVGVGRPDAAGDSVYNGADDNASGTSALIEVAEAFASLATPPKRSLLFLAVSGEEKGLLGSAHFAEHPTVPLERIVANINVDMIGRNAPDSIVVIGQEYSSLGPLVRDVGAAHPELGLTVARDIWPEQRFFFRSDHFNFARKEVPALFFFAGVHEDYHRPSDEVEEIDADKVARVGRLIFYTAYEIANRRERPRWTEEGLRDVRALTSGGR